MEKWNSEKFDLALLSPSFLQTADLCNLIQLQCLVLNAFGKRLIDVI